MKGLIVDSLTAGDGKRIFTRDFIGAGPRYIAGFIQDRSNQEIQTEVIRAEDFLVKDFEFLKQFNILCVSGMTMDLGVCLKIFRKWRKIQENPNNQLTLLGGPITNDPNILYKIQCDLIVNGEGEIALNSIFSKNLSKIKKISKITFDNTKKHNNWKDQILEESIGISYLNKTNNQIIINEIPSSEKNTWFKNSSGYPDKIKFYSDFRYSRIFIECLRGCSNFRRTSLILKNKSQCENSNCSVCRNNDFKTILKCPIDIPPGCGFCSTINEFGSPKSRDIDSIIYEIKYLIRHGACRIVLGGPGFLDYKRECLITTPLIHPKYPEPNYAKLSRLIENIINIEEIKNKKVQIFIENIKAVLCTEKALDIISQIPNCIFSIGCETGSVEFANILGRPGSPKSVLNAVKLATKKKIRVHVYFIHSLPGDNSVYANETLNFLDEFIKMNIDKITLYKFQELPGSPFYKISSHYTHFDKKTLRIFKQIKRKIINYNTLQKNKLIGKKVRVFLSELNMFHDTDAIGWILEGGPKVSVINSSNLMNTFQDVVIVKVLSDKLVLGKMI